MNDPSSFRFSQFLAMIVVLMGLVLSVPLSAGEAMEASDGKAAEETPPKTAKQLYLELEATFYTDKDLEKGKAKTVESHRKSVESKGVEHLTTGGSEKDPDIKTWAKKNLSDIYALQENYRAASKQARFPEQTLAFKVQVMCDCYAEAYQALAKEDLYTARSAMKRAVEKRREIRDYLAKQ